ncbi:MAG: hypothetical protein C4582_01410 [Desulfobacteraceae bacterium]|nr:MAG: hypothetical protein C4582_01410 [Desulfobacteraceae bacterium]
MHLGIFSQPAVKTIRPLLKSFSGLPFQPIFFSSLSPEFIVGYPQYVAYVRSGMFSLTQVFLLSIMPDREYLFGVAK